MSGIAKSVRMASCIRSVSVALALSLSALLCMSVSAQTKPVFTSPLPTGVRLDPAGEAVDLGSLPINLVLAPEADQSRGRAQRLARAGRSGRRSEDAEGHADAAPGWRVLRRRLLARRPSSLRLRRQHRHALRLCVERRRGRRSRTSSNWRRQKRRTARARAIRRDWRFAPNGKFVYVAENVGDRLAVVNAATGEIAQRFPTDHYPYGVALTADGQVFVSAWGGSTVSQFRVLADGTLAYLGRIEVGRHPSALAVNGTRLYVALAGSDRVAVVDTKLRKVVALSARRRARCAARGQYAQRRRVQFRWQASAGRGSRQQCRRRLRRGHRQVARARPDRLVSDRDRRSQRRTAGRLRQRPRHTRQSRWPRSAHELARWESDRLHARTVEWQPARAAIRDDHDANSRHSRSASPPRTTGSRGLRRGAIRRSATSSTSSKRTAPTIRCSET